METKFAGYSYGFFPFPSLRPLQTFLTYFFHFCVYTTFVFSRSQKKDFVMILIALSRLFQRFSVRVKTALFARTLRQPGGEKKRDPGNEFTSFSLLFWPEQISSCGHFQVKKSPQRRYITGIFIFFVSNCAETETKVYPQFSFWISKALAKTFFCRRVTNRVKCHQSTLDPRALPFCA